MIKSFQSHVVAVTHPSHPSESFQPYLFLILSIISTTFVAYGAQVLATNIHTYAATPILLQNAAPTPKKCLNVAKNYPTFNFYACTGNLQEEKTHTKDPHLFEQELHKAIN